LRDTGRGYSLNPGLIPHRGIQIERSTTMTTTNEYQVTGMTCGHCEMSVREEVGELSGVTDIQVSAQTGRLVVTSEEPLDDAQVLTAVEDAGYSAVKTR